MHQGEAHARGRVVLPLLLEEHLGQLSNALVLAFLHGRGDGGLLDLHLILLAVGVVADGDRCPPHSGVPLGWPRLEVLALHLRLLGLDRLPLDARRVRWRPRAAASPKLLLDKLPLDEAAGRRARRRPRPVSVLLVELSLNGHQIGPRRELAPEDAQQVVVPTQDPDRSPGIDGAREGEHEVVVLLDLAPLEQPALHGGQEGGGGDLVLPVRRCQLILRRSGNRQQRGRARPLRRRLGGRRRRRSLRLLP
mmetsp:Transcript_65085/g.167524  ORF Transcript_65085/g.167524 Transcript_65085/m.167524 type:complete len:250 (-) Transcript_65085:1229-1978(-)